MSRQPNQIVIYELRNPFSYKLFSNSILFQVRSHDRFLWSNQKLLPALEISHVTRQLVIASNHKIELESAEVHKPPASSKIQLKSPRRLKIIAPRVLGPAQLPTPLPLNPVGALCYRTTDGNGEI